MILTCERHHLSSENHSVAGGIEHAWPLLPGPLEASADHRKPSPKFSFCKRAWDQPHHSFSLCQQREACESSMTNLRKPHNPLPSPSLSMILSAELAEVMRKYSSHSELALRHTETEIQEIGPASSNGHQSTNQTLSRRKPVGFGLDLILQSNHQSYSHTSGLIYCTNWSLSWNQLVGRGRQG